jgi:uncharacterized protein YecT (DUF1311 family)
VSATHRNRRSLAGLTASACLIGWMLSVAPAFAQNMPRIDCEQAKTTPEIAWCAERDLDAADKLLNGAYQQALAHIAKADALSAAQREQWAGAMREAQRRWIAFRDQDCGEVIGWEWFGGTGMGAASLGCKIAKTEARTRELTDRYPGG